MRRINGALDRRRRYEEPDVRTAPDFETCMVRDRVSINTGSGATWATLPALIVSATPLQLELALRGRPADPETLAPGALVRIQLEDRTVVRAQVVVFDAGESPVVAVAALTPPTPEENNRAFHRMPVTMRETTLAVLAPGRTSIGRARILDLSGGGARILLQKRVANGDRVLVRLMLDGDQHTQVPGEVVWVRPLRRFWQAGIRFVDVPVAKHALIQRAVFQAEVRMRQVR